MGCHIYGIPLGAVGIGYVTNHADLFWVLETQLGHFDLLSNFLPKTCGGHTL